MWIALAVMGCAVRTSAPQPAAEEAPGWVDRAAWPWEPHFLDVGPGRLHYVDVGQGPVVLFVHGTPTWSFEYRHLIAALSQTHRCIAVDHLGFGLSDRPRDFPYTPEAHAQNLAVFVEELGLQRFSLVVHDFGGPIGLPLALNPELEVERLVILNSFAWSFEDDRKMRRMAGLVDGGLGRFLYRHANLELRVVAPSAWGDRRKLTREIQTQYLSVFPDAWSRGAVLWPLARALLASSAHYQGLWDARARLDQLPTLLVWGGKDPVFGRLLETWTQALPHAEVLLLEDAGHWPHEEEPQEVVRAVMAHL
jgi:haloalkane dehalogenase